MNEEFLKPYKKVQAVHEQIELDTLLSTYSKLYKQKFRGEPIFPVDNVHFRHIRDFKKASGVKALELLEHYFYMKDEWFIKCAYSLDCLVKNVQKVAASYSSTHHLRSLGEQITSKWNCDACGESFLFTRPHDYDGNKLTRCTQCTTDNKPFKKTTKEERRLSIIKFGKVFLDAEEKKNH